MTSTLLYEDIDYENDIPVADENKDDGPRSEQRPPLSQQSSTTTSLLSQDIPKSHTLVLIVDEEEEERDQTDDDDDRRRRNNWVPLDLLSQGENWVQLPSLKNHGGQHDDKPHILSSSSSSAAPAPNQETQNQSDFWLQTEASIIDDNLVGCFLCLDVDGTYVAVKDMRTTTTASDDMDWTVSLARAGHRRRGEGTNITAVRSDLEVLPRRQLRILYHKDCIVLQKQPLGTIKGRRKFVLQYHYDLELNESIQPSVLNKDNGMLLLNHSKNVNESQETRLTSAEPIRNNNKDDEEQTEAVFESQTEDFTMTPGHGNTMFLLSQEIIEKSQQQPKQDEEITPRLDEEEVEEGKNASQGRLDSSFPSDEKKFNNPFKESNNEHLTPKKVIVAATLQDAPSDEKNDTSVLPLTTVEAPSKEKNAYCAISKAGPENQQNQQIPRLLTQPTQQNPNKIVFSDFNIMNDNDNKLRNNDATRDRIGVNDDNNIDEYDDDDSTVDPDDDPIEATPQDEDEIMKTKHKLPELKHDDIDEVESQKVHKEALGCLEQHLASTEATKAEGSTTDEKSSLPHEEKMKEKENPPIAATPPKDIKFYTKAATDEEGQEEVTSVGLLTPVGPSCSPTNQNNLPREVSRVETVVDNSTERDNNCSHGMQQDTTTVTTKDDVIIFDSSGANEVTTRNNDFQIVGPFQVANIEASITKQDDKDEKQDRNNQSEIERMTKILSAEDDNTKVRVENLERHPLPADSLQIPRSGDHPVSQRGTIRRKRVVGSIPPQTYLSEEDAEEQDPSTCRNGTKRSLSWTAGDSRPQLQEVQQERTMSTPTRTQDDTNAEMDAAYEAAEKVIETPKMSGKEGNEVSQLGRSLSKSNTAEESETAGAYNEIVKDNIDQPKAKKLSNRKKTAKEGNAAIDKNENGDPSVSNLDASNSTPLVAGSVSTRPSRKRNAAALEAPVTESKETEDVCAPSVSAMKRSRHTSEEPERSKVEVISAKRVRHSSTTIKKNDDKKTDEEEIRVVVTGLELNQSHKKMLKSINGVLLENIEDARKATHAIVSDGTASIRRTPKLMIALCRTPNIVTLDWLTQSSTIGKALPCDRFLVLDDCKAEKMYSFSFGRTIDKIKSNLKRESYLFDGWSVFVCKGVAGNKAPPEKELRLIVEAGGGRWLTSLSSSTKGKDMKDTLIITSDPEPKKQVTSKDVVSALKNGATKKTTSWLFRATMTQDLDL